MELFYCPDIADNSAQLSEEESYHCVKILRHKTGDTITFTDGRGFFYESRIIKADTKKCELLIIEAYKSKTPKDYYLHLAIAPTKNIDRIEFFVEKATEIGVDEITFLKCERSERKEIKIERMNKIAISAMKQSKKAYAPQIAPMLSFKTFIEGNFGTGTNKFIGCLIDKESLEIKNLREPLKESLILIGPEGDFSPKELELALKNRFKPILLGNNILRTETAGIVACSWINYING